MTVSELIQFLSDKDPDMEVKLDVEGKIRSICNADIDICQDRFSSSFDTYILLLQHE